MEGIDWRGWSAADRSAVAYLLLKRQYATDPAALRDLYELVGDKDALAALDRAMMNQSRTIETTR